MSSPERQYGVRRVAAITALTVLLTELLIPIGAALMFFGYLSASADQYWTALAIVFAGVTVAILAGYAIAWPKLRPCFRWLRDPGAGACRAEDAWISATNLAWHPIRRVASLGLLTFLAPLCVWAIPEFDLSLWQAVAFVVGCGVVVPLAAVVIGIVADALLKPVVAQIGQELPAGWSPPPSPWNVPRKTAVATISVCVLAIFITGALIPNVDDAQDRLTIAIAIGIGWAALFTVPMLVLLGENILQPLSALREAATRVGAGDLSTPVPPTSADEFGSVVISFNSLQERVGEQLDELRTSRARVIAASDAERRRVERNLHDGAQQRLVALALQLQVLEEGATEPDQREKLADASAELKGALEELRELARGLHPQVLTTGGLAPALEQLAGRAAIPVEVTATHERYPEHVESTAYFVASEALANVAKYSQAKQRRRHRRASQRPPHARDLRRRRRRRRHEKRLGPHRPCGPRRRPRRHVASRESHGQGHDRERGIAASRAGRGEVMTAAGTGPATSGFARWIEEGYERDGLRGVAKPTIGTYAGCFALILLIEGLGALVYWRLSVRDFLVVLGVGALLTLAAHVVALLVFRGDIAHVFAWERAGKPPAEARPMWEHVSRLPVSWITRCACVVAVVLVPAMALFVADLAHQSMLGVAAIGGVLLVAVGIMWAGAVFGLELAIRPILKELWRQMQGEQVEIRGWKLRTRALIPVPLIALASAGTAAAAIVPLDDRAAQLAVSLLAGVFFGALLLVALRYIITEAVLIPVRDLTAGVERVTHGVLTESVPVTSTDELAELAQTFNAMQGGLREREALRSERGELLDEVHASRARIVSASDAERRRVERNLHDGAQQRLVAVALQLRLLEERLGFDPESRALAEKAGAELHGALEDLRELARGLHPQVLSEGGLAPALEQLADRATIPVDVSATHDRYPEDVESTAYFVASEALANVAKYAQAQHAKITAERRNGRLTLAISDDGVGGADANSGSGLTGLADRVAALDGTLDVQSPSGAGTTVTVELPLSTGPDEDQG